MDSLGERLKNLRIDNRFTQKEVVEKLGITGSTLSQYERNKRVPKNDLLVQLADLYNVSTDYLLGHINNRDIEYSFDPPKPLHLSSSSEYSYDASPVPSQDNDVNDAKTRFLATINKLPPQKQLQVLTICELLIGAMSKD